MDEVRAERLMEKHGCNALLNIIQMWPQLEKYQKNPELIPSLEYLVWEIINNLHMRFCVTKVNHRHQNLPLS